jgi:predicted nucleotidyltransferase
MSSLPRHAAIALPLPELADFCRRWKIARLEVFGSALREDFGPESDVDFLATFEADAHLSLFDLVEAERELGELIGRKADLVERPDVERSQNPIRRQSILETARVVYDAA